MSALPDDLWRRILEIGVRTRLFTYKDLCCLSISSRRLHTLSDENCLWSSLLLSDFPSLSSSSSSSSLSSKINYQIRFERVREKRIAAHKRVVLRKESQIIEHSRRLLDMEAILLRETDKMTMTVSELSNLRRARQASIALNVWQPEVIRDMQKEIVEQCTVPIESRAQSLEMELKVCKHRLSMFEYTYKVEKRRLDLAKQELSSIKYHPLGDLNFTSTHGKECSLRVKRLKQINQSIRTSPTQDSLADQDQLHSVGSPTCSRCGH